MWEAYADWFHERGYTLHLSRVNQDLRKPEALAPRDAPHPYAVYYYDKREPVYHLENPVTKSTHMCSRLDITYLFKYLVAYAQDKLHREVVIKATYSDSEEYKIYKLLMGCCELYDPTLFPSVLPPIDIISPGPNMQFIVLPRYFASTSYFN